jgi:hypothetical protein
MKHANPQQQGHCAPPAAQLHEVVGFPIGLEASAAEIIASKTSCGRLSALRLGGPAGMVPQQRRARAVAGALELGQLATVPLGRPTMQCRRPARRHSGAPGPAARAAAHWRPSPRSSVRAIVAGPRVAKTAPHDQLDALIALLQLDALADVHLAGRLDPLTLDPNAAQFDRRQRQRTRLEKARRPQPLVDPHATRIIHFAQRAPSALAVQRPARRRAPLA